jgi:hypothetical protein
MTPLGVKTGGESEYNIFEAKKRFPDSGKAYCVLKRKVAKKRFLTKNDPFWGKNVRGKKAYFLDQNLLFLEFSRRYTAFLKSEELYHPVLEPSRGLLRH